MIIDDRIFDGLESHFVGRKSLTVYRVTGAQGNPYQMSAAGGRWSIDTGKPEGFSVLYTAMSRDCALAEVGSYLLLLTPVPKKDLAVHRFSIDLEDVVALDMAALESLGVYASTYKTRDYSRTREIALAAMRMDYDGLIVPSARHPSDNVVILDKTYFLRNSVEVEHKEVVAYEEWAAIAKEL